MLHRKSRQCEDKNSKGLDLDWFIFQEEASRLLFD